MNKKPHEYLKTKRNYRRRALIDLKGSKCKECGYNKSYWALDFHHKDPKTKKFKLSGINLTKYSWPEILEELHKCDLLCKNCHAEKEAIKNKNYM